MGPTVEQLEQKLLDAGVVLTELPLEYLCPISGRIMADPVKASDNQIYDRTSIKPLADRKANSPYNRKPLWKTLHFEKDLKQKIHAYVEKKTSTAEFKAQLNNHGWLKHEKRLAGIQARDENKRRLNNPEKPQRRRNSLETITVGQDWSLRS